MFCHDNMQQVFEGDVSHLLKNENLLGRELVVHKTSDKKRYVIDIERKVYKNKYCFIAVWKG